MWHYGKLKDKWQNKNNSKVGLRKEQLIIVNCLDQMKDAGLL